MTEHFWACNAVENVWHSARLDAEGYNNSDLVYLEPLCGGEVFLEVKQEILPMLTPVVFGPVCATCARSQGVEDERD